MRINVRVKRERDHDPVCRQLNNNKLCNKYLFECLVKKSKADDHKNTNKKQHTWTFCSVLSFLLTFQDKCFCLRSRLKQRRFTKILESFSMSFSDCLKRLFTSLAHRTHFICQKLGANVWAINEKSSWDCQQSPK